MEDPPVLSFPAILRGPGLSARFAHLQASQNELTAAVPPVIKKLQREHEGKRWIRRKDNSHFVGNPHITPATKNDYSVPIPRVHPTFPEPLPVYLQRNAQVPPTISPEHDPMSANAGRFSLSLKGMRRGLRRSGLRAESLVQNVEHEIQKWLTEGGTVLDPDNQEADDLAAPGTPVGNTGTIFEVSRTPLQLIWHTEGDSFARYIVHCCARYYEVVSFSKEVHGRRLTYLLRPNVTKPDHRALSILDTPPVTDIDYSSHPDTESDRGGVDTDSDVEHLAQLPAISEDPQQAKPSLSCLSETRSDEEAWSIVGDTDVEGDDSGSDSELVATINTMALGPEDARQPPSESILHQHTPFRRLARPHARALSSPSRSPARRPLRWTSRRYDKRRSKALVPPSNQKQSLYDYLFS